MINQHLLPVVILTVSSLVQQFIQVILLTPVQELQLSEPVHQVHMLLVQQDFGAIHAQLVFYMLQVPPQLPVLLLFQVVQFIIHQQLVNHAIQVST
jgi:hypothetical protein